MDKLDELGDAYNKGVRAGQAHSIPSPETLRFMERQEKTNELLISGQEKLSEGVNKIQVHLVKQDDKLEVIYNELKGNVEVVDRHDSWINSNKDFIDNLKENKKEFKKHWKTTVWDLFKVGVISLVSVLIGLISWGEISSHFK